MLIAQPAPVADASASPWLTSEPPAAALQQPSVSAVMPCLNEEKTLATCIVKAQRCFEALGIDGEVIVADNGSTDRSVEIALALGARVVHQPLRGYGAALQAGFAAARGDIVVMGDADDSYDWSAMGSLIDKVDEGYDLVMGNRFHGGIEKGAMPALHRYLGNPALSFLSRLVFEAPIGDFHCGMRAFSRVAYGRIAAQAPGMEFATEMVAGAARGGLRIAEVPVTLHCDKRDRPPHLRSFRDGWRHLRFIVGHAPDHLYLWPGGLLLAVGLALQAALVSGPVQTSGVYLGIHFLALAGLLSIVGLNVLWMGALAKLMVHSRYPAYATPFVGRLKRHFRLERGLTAAALLIAAGLSGGTVIVSRWMAAPGEPMQDTVHLAFVSMNAIALGANVAFSSFLLQLLLGSPSRGHDVAAACTTFLAESR